MRDELVAGIEWFRTLFSNTEISKHILVGRCSIFHPANDEKPFANVRNLYKDRLALKRLHDIAEKNIKLVINSALRETGPGRRFE